MKLFTIILILSAFSTSDANLFGKMWHAATAPTRELFNDAPLEVKQEIDNVFLVYDWFFDNLCDLIDAKTASNPLYYVLLKFNQCG